MSGSHRHYSSWNHLHGDEDQDDAPPHVGRLCPPPSSESTDLLSEFFGPLTLDFSAPQPTAEETAVVDVANGAVNVGGGGLEEEEEEEVEVERASSTTSDDGKRIQEDGESCGPPHKRKRNRTTEMHNMTERKRRDDIKRKLKALQEIVPNSHKLDRASLLDETIAYVKALKVQIQMMQASGMCHSPPGGGAMHCLHMPHLSPFSHMGVGMDMGMGYGMGMSGSVDISPIMSSMPSPMVATNMVQMPAGFSSIPPTYCPLSQPMPYISLPEYSPTGLPPVLRPGPFSSHRGGEPS